MVKHTSELPQRLNEAFEIAVSRRPGPILVDLPNDVTAGVLQQAILTMSALPSLLLAEMQQTVPIKSIAQ